MPDLNSPEIKSIPSNGIDLLPNVELPGIRIPRPDFNWQTFRLARQNPQLFMRIVKTIILEITERQAQYISEKFDPKNIDLSTFYRFRNGILFE